MRNVVGVVDGIRKTTASESSATRAFIREYLIASHCMTAQQAEQQLSQEPSPSGLAAFHFDADKRNFYLLIVTPSTTPEALKEPLQCLIDNGLLGIFGDPSVKTRDPFLSSLRSSLADNESRIDRVCVHLVFAGDPKKAETSCTIDSLKESLEMRKHLIDRYFERPVTLVIDIRSIHSIHRSSTIKVRSAQTYPLRIRDAITTQGPNGELMLIGVVPVVELTTIYRQMGSRLFDRNIRSALSHKLPVNSAIRATVKNIILDRSEDPRSFIFHHSGITIAAEAVTKQNGAIAITEPRLLNGAQTVMTIIRFLEELHLDKLPQESQRALKEITVIGRIVTNAATHFVTEIAVSNNHQTPVHPWNLRANDMIQLELQDKFRSELGIFYERQENSFLQLSPEELEEIGITHYRAVDMVRLARTFLVTDGLLSAYGRLNEVFGDPRSYTAVFHAGRLLCDSRVILVCYKVQFFLSAAAKLLAEAPRAISFGSHARPLLWSLLCQALLNSPDLPSLGERWGMFLGMEIAFKEWLSATTMNQCHAILSELSKQLEFKQNIDADNFNCLSSKRAFEETTRIAQQFFGWQLRRLT